MTPDLVFSLAGAVVLPAWAALVFAPRWAWSQRLAAWVAPGLLAVAYVVVLGGVLAGPLGPWRGGFGSLGEVAALFANPWALAAGWAHYLAFDLFVGAWEVRDARRRGIPHLAVVPCLVLTFLAGPAGWGLYALVRLLHRGAPQPPSAAS